MARRSGDDPRNDGPDRGPEGDRGEAGALLALAAVALIAVATLTGLFADRSPPIDALSYSEFKTLAEQGAFTRVEMRGSELIGVGDDGARRSAQAPPMDDPALLPILERTGTEIVSSPPAAGGSWLIAFLPWLLFIGVYIFFMRRMMGMQGRLPGGGGADDFLGGFTKRRAYERPPVTFADVAGQEDAKAEVVELVDFLRNPERFTRVGAEAPRGVLLMGPPGTGKTLLARALAGEAGVPFFSTSASEFIELFVGVGASRVRKMFEEAKKRAPAIIFIDELDSVGRVRGAGFGGGHDEREQTLNQILAELDGFDARDAVVVLAATNRPDVLDPALLRPGRFDRHVTLNLPDREARRAILAVHVRKLPLARDVDLAEIAGGTPGFSGADLKNLANEAAITAAREGASQVTRAHFDAARDKIMMGTARTLAIQPDEKHRLAVHEAGHAAVAWRTAEADPLYKVSIIPRGRSLGGAHFLPTAERHTLPEPYLRALLSVMLGGRAAEALFLGSVSSGADDDIRRATAAARNMVARWGMAEEIGPVDLADSDEHPFLGREMARHRSVADATAALVDAAVSKELIEAETRARALLERHRASVEKLVARLEAEETLDAAAVRACLGPGAHEEAAAARETAPAPAA
ncbi:MAG: ATP-dependent zinc metalloprotease FtsH [Rhodobacteraceae bacterium]|nr:MAG: ATP-dependent zinc metalloprotease FtsH [Paracoccaceae bacterium]